MSIKKPSSTPGASITTQPNASSYPHPRLGKIGSLVAAAVIAVAGCNEQRVLVSLDDDTVNDAGLDTSVTRDGGIDDNASDSGFDIRFDSDLLSDAGIDAPDTGIDSGLPDADTSAELDGSTDTGRDTGMDTAGDANPDTDTDGDVRFDIDTSTDTEMDTAGDIDTGYDGSDVGSDADHDIGTDTPGDAAFDSSIDVGGDAGTDTAVIPEHCVETMTFTPNLEISELARFGETIIGTVDSSEDLTDIRFESEFTRRTAEAPYSEGRTFGLLYQATEFRLISSEDPTIELSCRDGWTESDTYGGYDHIMLSVRCDDGVNWREDVFPAGEYYLAVNFLPIESDGITGGAFNTRIVQGINPSGSEIEPDCLVNSIPDHLLEVTQGGSLIIERGEITQPFANFFTNDEYRTGPIIFDTINEAVILSALEGSIVITRDGSIIPPSDDLRINFRGNFEGVVNPDGHFTASYHYSTGLFNTLNGLRIPIHPRTGLGPTEISGSFVISGFEGQEGDLITVEFRGIEGDQSDLAFPPVSIFQITLSGDGSVGFPPSP